MNPPCCCIAQGNATAKRELTRAQKSISDLSAAKQALESTCDELEERSAQQCREIESLEGQLHEAQAGLAAAVTAAVLAAERSAAERTASSSSSREQKQVSLRKACIILIPDSWWRTTVWCTVLGTAQAAVDNLMMRARL